eukprot:CAMPEP_0171312410 /NCGR_PEP_ID=MMETSP0816-20121228/22657_1 /TAXON_ID=420281 /ORGANISM="Proboscia inermis, Strain CCAP1064/1" /LENGTH=278 /DNA_ID=CAMNT_0011797759 /DNA_START=156 /DNA_END=992 /DNA_ORIENTATION=-
MYINKFKNILRSHQGIFTQMTTISNEDDLAVSHCAESDLLRRALQIERNALAGGIVIGLAAFASIRHGPSFIVRSFGTEKNAASLLKSENLSRKDSKYFLRSFVRLSVEGAFGAWAATKTYAAVSRYGSSNDVYDEIGRIPLISGRSVLSDGLCQEWIVAHKEIQSDFWKTVASEDRREAQLRDPRAWKAIHSFAENCFKRRAYEKDHRTKNGMKDDDPVNIPSGGVPSTISISGLVEDDKKIEQYDTSQLSETEVVRLISDDKTSITKRSIIVVKDK